MTRGSASRVLGADACRAGWVGITLSDEGAMAYVHAEIAGLIALAGEAGPLAVVGIDIPIGLADAGLRQADLLARRAAGQRWASVFMTPVRAAVEAADYQQACEKILQVDRWLPQARCPVVEVHPELCFAELAGAPLADSKSTWSGAARRRQLLAAEGIVLAGDLGLAGRQVGVDDVLDAAAVAWTARRVASGGARRLPAEPECFSDQVDCAIWT